MNFTMTVFGVTLTRSESRPREHLFLLFILSVASACTSLSTYSYVFSPLHQRHLVRSFELGKQKAVLLGELGG